MLNTEIASLLGDTQKVFEVAQKVDYNLNLNAEEKDMVASMDAWAKSIGEKGKDVDCEIAEFVRKTVQEEVYNAPDELLDMIFNRGQIGEYDDVRYDKIGKNTLVAHESAQGGTVDKSYIDYNAIAPSYKNFQIDTQISYRDLRRNGFKTIANLTTWGKEALQNKLFNDVFSQLDTALVNSSQVFTSTTASPTATEMDALQRYCLDRDVNAVAVGLSSHIQDVMKMSGYKDYYSEAMKDQFNRYGIVSYYQGLKLAQISKAKKQGNGDLLLPENRIFGIAGKIGNLDMRGDIHVYQDMDNQNETVNIYIKDFQYGLAITDLDKVAKVVLTA